MPYYVRVLKLTFLQTRGNHFCLSHCSFDVKGHHDQGNSCKIKCSAGYLLTISEGESIIVMTLRQHAGRQMRCWATADFTIWSLDRERLQAQPQWHTPSTPPSPYNLFQITPLPKQSNIWVYGCGPCSFKPPFSYK